MQVIETHSRMIVISRSSPDFSRRDVVTRGESRKSLGSLSRNELEMWVESMGLSDKISARFCMSVLEGIL